MRIAKAKQCAMCHDEEATMCFILNKVQICGTCYYAVNIGVAFARILRFLFMGKPYA